MKTADFDFPLPPDRVAQEPARPRDAARLRLRPILMTAFSFILGVIPLVIATGAGAESRRSIGVCVVYGLAASTLLSLVIVPTFYALLVTVRDRMWGAPAAEGGAAVPSGDGHGH